MRAEVQKAIAKKFYEDALQLIETKGNDYANSDRLSNFKKVANITGGKPCDAIVTLLSVKLARVVELCVNNKVPNHESLRDNLIDMANYCNLLWQVYSDFEHGFDKDWD